FAIARMETKNRQGFGRLSAVASYFGLAWNDVLKISQGNGTALRRQQNDAISFGAENWIDKTLIDCAVDLLYSMGKKGEDVAALSNGLHLRDYREFKLSVANKPIDEEVKATLHYIDALQVISDRESMQR